MLFTLASNMSAKLKHYLIWGTYISLDPRGQRDTDFMYGTFGTSGEYIGTSRFS